MRVSRERHGFDMLFLNSLLSLFAFITPSYAQATTDSPTSLPESSTTPPPAPSTSLPTLSTLLTTSTFTPKPPPLPVYPTATPTSTPGAYPHDTIVFNYYFLFLAALALLVIGLVWYFHVQRARRKHEQRVSGQHALARDLEGWAGGRRFMAGRYGRDQAAGRAREEGLDENGDAPPPYQLKNEVNVGTGEVAVPLRAVVRDEGRPPGYSAETRA
jgi:hypothetical protein